jgi:hypothetical protein
MTPHQERELAAVRESDEALLAFARMLDSLSLWPSFFRHPFPDMPLVMAAVPG